MFLIACLVLTGVTALTPEERLMEWAVGEGAELRAVIARNAQGVRGLFATEDIKKDEMVVDIPDHIIFSLRNAPAAETAPYLLKEMLMFESRLAPYLAVLPKPGEVLTGYNWPEEYVPFLASDALVNMIEQSFKRHAADVWSGKLDDNQDITLREAVGTHNVTLEEFQHIVAVITSRTFQTRTAALSMVPIADMANHHPDGENEIGTSFRGHNNFIIVAGRDLKKGEEVTISYGDMRNDDLLLYYGFLDEYTMPPRLCACDHRNYTAAESDSETLPKEELTGPYEAVEAEIGRLKGIMEAVAARLQELGPIPRTIPYVADLLESFHKLRRWALLHEITRLEILIKEL